MNEHGHLITVAQFKALARPTSCHLDDNEVMAFIAECEDVNIIPCVGYGNFSHVLNDGDFDGIFDDTFDIDVWLNGGEFSSDCGCSTNTEWCAGLRKTLAYYVYAKMLRSDGTILARAGAMRHNDQYANHVDPNRKQYDDVMNVADRYLASCQLYARVHSLQCDTRPVKGARATIKAIGD